MRQALVSSSTCKAPGTGFGEVIAAARAGVHPFVRSWLLDATGAKRLSKVSILDASLASQRWAAGANGVDILDHASGLPRVLSRRPRRRTSRRLRHDPAN
jgi:hypothetical protein